MQKRLHKSIYITSDIFCALFSWILFFLTRKIREGYSIIEQSEEIFLDPNFLYGIFILPFFWFLLHCVFGYYRNIYRKSFSQDAQLSFTASITGVLFLFLSIVLDDVVETYKDYYLYLSILFLSYFPLLFLLRTLITSKIKKNIRLRKFGFNTLLIGCGEKAKNIYDELSHEKSSSGNIFIGYIDPREDKSKFAFKPDLPLLGNVSDISKLLKELKIDEIIIALEAEDHPRLSLIISEIQSNNLLIKVIPEINYILLGGIASSTSVTGTPLISLFIGNMPYWQKLIKRGLDILLSCIALFILSPLCFFMAWRIRKESKGGIFYKQERIGLHGRFFKIYKFRTMYSDAEKGTPLLSSKNDERITPFGKIMRKYRLDEIPQFYNVIKGEMSLVGPRPERDFFVKKIVKTAPQYRLLFNTKPGISSWGMTKFGYAENVPEMIERMKYDLIYLENMTLLIDFKILLSTIGVIVKGKGK